jgi:WD40 repeat protein
LRFDPAGGRLVAPAWDGTIRVFATPDPDVELRVDADERLIAGELFDDGRRFATSSSNTLSIWSTTGARLGQLDTLRDSRIQINRNGERAVVLLSGTQAEIRDVATGTLVARLHGTAHFLSAAFDHANKRIVTGSAAHLVELWDLDGNHLATLRGHRDIVVSVAFSPDDRRIASGSADQTARVWDISTGQETSQVRGADFVASVEFDPTGTRLLTGNSDRLVRLWDIATRVPVLTFEHGSQVRSATLSPGGALVAGATDDGTVDVWDTGSSTLLAQFHHGASAHSVRFSATDSLLSTSSDHHAVIWRLGTEHRSHETVTAFVRCHAPYRLVETRLEFETPVCGPP